MELLLAASVDAEPGDPRSVLRILAGSCERSEGPGGWGPDGCPNCGGPVGTMKSPYCRARCREEAAFVRQMRAALASGTIRDLERQAHMGQALWHLLGGGYPHRVTLIPASARRQVMKREQGKCQTCGAPATTFDHVGSG